jgi:hypothetical protein
MQLDRNYCAIVHPAYYEIILPVSSNGFDPEWVAIIWLNFDRLPGIQWATFTHETRNGSMALTHVSSSYDLFVFLLANFFVVWQVLRRTVRIL